MSAEFVRIPKEYFDYFENLYLNNQDVNIAIDVVVDNTVGGGFEIEPSSERQEEKVKMLKEFSNKTELPRLLYEVTKDILVFGNAFVENVIKEGEGIVDLKIHDPRTIGIVTNPNGEIQGYVKVDQNKIIRRFRVDEIAHFTNQQKKGFYGKSQIEQLVPVLKEQLDIPDIPEL